jgi:PAS domain-containing protein
MRQTVAMRDALGEDAARVEVLTGLGRARKDQIRLLIAEMREVESQLLSRRVEGSERSARLATANYAALVVAVLALLGSVYRLVRLDFAEKARVEEELRVSRERYATAVRGSRDGLWDWDVVSGQCYFSPRWKAMLGYEEGEIADNYDQFAALLHPDDLERAESTIGAYLAGSPTSTSRRSGSATRTGRTDGS